LRTRIGVTPRAPEDLSQRCFEFSCNAYDYCEELVRLKGLPARVGYQLWDAASSVGANRAESRSAYSAKEELVSIYVTLVKRLQEKLVEQPRTLD
jgi:hypothetical protein